MRIKHIILTVLIGALFFSAPVHARMFSNSSGSAYAEGDGTNGAEGAILASSSTIEELVIKGAEYYFKAHAEISLLSAKVEISDIYGPDFSTLDQAVNDALENMNLARYFYQELQNKANHTSYNQLVINKLQDFNYDLLQEQNDLFKDVFSEVKGYLIKGDTRGIYRRTSAHLDSLIRILETIKEELSAGKIPSNNLMWSLNQLCAKAHMFGQYVARVFDAIK